MGESASGQAQEPTPDANMPPTAEPAAQLDVPGVLRALRRRADLSQRDLAAVSGVPAATIGHIEAGASGSPRLRTVEQLVNATGARLAVLDVDGTEPVPPADEWRDAAARRFPPHLDAHPQDEWCDGRLRHVISFTRNRAYRDECRRDRSEPDLHHGFAMIRQLGAGDAEALETLRTDAAAYDLAIAAEPDLQPPVHHRITRRLVRSEHVTLPDQQTLRYLRDPALRHWAVEAFGLVLGYVVAYVHRSYTGRTSLLVTDIGVRVGNRDGPVGPLLVEAVRAEAARLQVDQVMALTSQSAVADYLCGLGFVQDHDRLWVLTLGRGP